MLSLQSIDTLDNIYNSQSYICCLTAIGHVHNMHYVTFDHIKLWKGIPDPTPPLHTSPGAWTCRFLRLNRIFKLLKMPYKFVLTSPKFTHCKRWRIPFQKWEMLFSRSILHAKYGNFSRPYRAEIFSPENFPFSGKSWLSIFVAWVR